MRRIAPYQSLDIFRGIAAIWVVLAHTVSTLDLSPGQPYLHAPFFLFAKQGQLGVSLFFVISGYCIVAAAFGAVLSGKSFWRYCYDRVRRIYPPYYAGAALALMSHLALTYVNSHNIVAVHHIPTLHMTPKFWLATLTLTQTSLHTDKITELYWSLNYEVCFYLIIGVMLIASKWIARAYGAAAAAVTIAVTLAVTMCGSLAWMTAVGVGALPYDKWHQFAIGGVLFCLLELKADSVVGLTSRARRVIIASGVVAGAAMVMYAVLRSGTIYEDAFNAHSSRVRTIFCLAFAVFLLLLKPFDKAVAKMRILFPLIWVGAFSYSLYLTHDTWLGYLDVAMRHVVSSPKLYWVSSLVRLLLTIAFARVFFLLCERPFISAHRKKELAAEHAIPPANGAAESQFAN